MFQVGKNLQWKILNSTMSGLMEQTQREVSQARAVVFKMYSSLLLILFKKIYSLIIKVIRNVDNMWK